MNIARAAGFLKNNGWVLNLAFTFVGSYFVAGAANAFVAKGVRLLPSLEEAASHAAPGAHKPVVQREISYAAMADRNVFGVRRETIDPVPAGEEGEGGAPLVLNLNDLKPCTIAGTLRATLVADGRPEWSMAVVVSNATQEPQVYSINPGSNQFADDATIVEIKSREIIVRRRDHFESCKGEGEVSSTPAASQPLASTSGDDNASEEVPSGGEAGGGVTRLSDTQYNVDRAEVDRALGNLNQVATQARIVPSFKNGKANGFKMFSIKPESIFGKIGLKNGDVIQKINGFEINSPDKVLEVYQKLRDARSVSIDLQRRGQPMNMNYNIQ